MENLDQLKRQRSGAPHYRLSHANVWVSPGGFHFIDHLDPLVLADPVIDGRCLTERDIAYIERSLQSNPHRLKAQVDAARRALPLAGCRALDIGCGGGQFLAALRAEGAQVTGVELSGTRAYYTQWKHGIEVIQRPIDDDWWWPFAGTFHLVTLWDVIEHVNYPLATLAAAARLLAPGGVLLIDTPCRDSLYHRCGELTYRLSGGRFPTFLNAMYSSHPFGHKQIFSVAELTAALQHTGLAQIKTSRFHELSFPPSFYLGRLVKPAWLARALEPLARTVIALVPVRNKVLASGRKPT